MGVFLGILSIVPLLTVTAVIILGIGLVFSAIMCVSLGHIPPWIRIPYLSLIGMDDPEKTFIAISMIGAGFILFFCAVFYCVTFLSFAARAETPQKRIIFRVIVFAASGAAAVAYAAAVAMNAFPLQSNLYHALHGYADFTDDSRSHDTAGRVCWIAMAVFAVLNEAMTFVVPFLVNSPIRFPRRIIGIFAIAAGIAEKFCHPKLPTTQRVIENMFHAGAILEWTSLGCFGGFVICLAFDLTLMLSRLNIKVPLFGRCACLTHQRIPQEVEMDEQ